MLLHCQGQLVTRKPELKLYTYQQRQSSVNGRQGNPNRGAFGFCGNMIALSNVLNVVIGSRTLSTQTEINW